MNPLLLDVIVITPEAEVEAEVAEAEVEVVAHWMKEIKYIHIYI